MVCFALYRTGTPIPYISPKQRVRGKQRDDPEPTEEVDLPILSTYKKSDLVHFCGQ